MHLVSRLLEWVTTALFGRRTGKHSRTPAPPAVPLAVRGRHAARSAAPPVAPRVVRNRPSPDVGGARLVAPSTGRSNSHTPVPHPLWEDTGAMIRPYVRQLPSTPRTARVGVHVDPWGDVR